MAAFLISLIMVLVPFSAVPGQAAGRARERPAAPGAPSDGATSPGTSREKARENALNELLPEPLTQERLSGLASAIWPEGDTRDAALAAVTEYLNATAAAREKSMRPLRVRFDAAYTWDPALKRFDPQPGPEAVALHEGRLLWLATLDAAEKQLMDQLGSLPRPAGALSVAPFRFDRIMERDDRMIHDPAAALRVDKLLSALTLTPQERARINDLLDRWRTRYGDAMRARRSTIDRLALDRIRLETEWEPYWRLAAPARQRFANERALEDLAAQELATEPLLADITKETLTQLRSLLPAEASRVLVEKSAHAAHPELYEEDRRLSEIIERLSASPGLTAEARQTMITYLVIARERMDGLENQSIKAALERDEADKGLALEPLSRGAAISRLQAEKKLLNLAAKRRGFATDAVRAARGMLVGTPPESIRFAEESLLAIAASGRSDAWRLQTIERKLAELGTPSNAPEGILSGTVRSPAEETPPAPPASAPGAEPSDTPPSNTPTTP